MHNEKAWCGYYFVSHRNRILFWLETFEADEHIGEMKGELHPTHMSRYPDFFDLILNRKNPVALILELFLEVQYWYKHLQVPLQIFKTFQASLGSISTLQQSKC